MKLTACMIIKNEEEMLKKTLPSISGGVDELVFVDTGSIDQSKEVALSFGAKVYDFKWINDFAAARNESLSHATGDWIIWVDADEYIKPEDFKKIRETLESSKEDSHTIEIRECEPGKLEYDSFYLRDKIFKNGLGISFKREINEQLYYQDGRSMPKNVIPGVCIYHWGARQEEGKKMQKKDRNITMLEEQVKKYPKDPFFRYLLASNYKDKKDYEKALFNIDELLKIENLSVELTVSCLTIKAGILYNMKNGKDAYMAAKKALELDSNNPAALNLVGLILAGVKAFEDASNAFSSAAKVDFEKSKLMSKNIKDVKYFPFYYGGLVLEMAGKKDEALNSFVKASEFMMTKEVAEKIEANKNGN